MGGVSQRSPKGTEYSNYSHRHAKAQGQTNVTLRDIQKSLSGIGVSLLMRVIEDREKR